MRTLVKGKNLDVRDADRSYAEQKMRRLERYLDDRTDAIVELAVEHNGRVEDSHIAEVQLIIDGQPLRGVARAASHHAALDIVIDRLERRAVGFREKPRVRARPPEEKSLLRSLADGTSDTEPRVRTIVKVKRFGIEPMFEEDAAARMEELGHSFFVFVNAENERVSVLYRRTDGDFGLIEPMLDGGYSKGAGPRQR